MAPRSIWVSSCLLSRHCTLFNGGKASALAAAGGFSITRQSFSSSSQPPTTPQTPEQTTTTSTKLTFPWLMVPPGVVEGEKFKSQKTDQDFYNFFSRQEDKVIKVKKVPDFPHENARCVGSSHGWLAFTHPPNSVSLVNPFLAQNPDSNQDHHFSLPPLEADSCDIKKLILSSDPHDKNCIAAAIIGPERKLAYCRPSAWKKKWIFLEGEFSSWGLGCGEIYYSNEDQRLYTTDTEVRYRGNFIHGVQTWDLTNDRVRTTTCDLPIDHFPINHKYGNETRNGLRRATLFLRKRYHDMKRYLVESSGEMFVVLRFVAESVSEKSRMHDLIPLPSPQDMDKEEEKDGIFKTYQFEVYRWNRVQNRMEIIESLDNRALFVGLNHSFSLSTSDFIEMGKFCTEDVVYFTDDNFEKTDISGYDNICGGFFEFTPIRSVSASEMFPTSRKIYPPPIWVHP